VIQTLTPEATSHNVLATGKATDSSFLLHRKNRDEVVWPSSQQNADAMSSRPERASNLPLRHDPLFGCCHTLLLGLGRPCVVSRI
jgi:hypothetical protein